MRNAILAAAAILALSSGTVFAGGGGGGAPQSLINGKQSNVSQATAFAGASPANPGSKRNAPRLLVDRNGVASPGGSG